MILRMFVYPVNQKFDLAYPDSTVSFQKPIGAYDAHLYDSFLNQTQCFNTAVKEVWGLHGQKWLIWTSYELEETQNSIHMPGAILRLKQAKSLIKSKPVIDLCNVCQRCVQKFALTAASIDKKVKAKRSSTGLQISGEEISTLCDLQESYCYQDSLNHKRCRLLILRTSCIQYRRMEQNAWFSANAGAAQLTAEASKLSSIALISAEHSWDTSYRESLVLFLARSLYLYLRVSCVADKMPKRLPKITTKRGGCLENVLSVAHDY